MRKFFVLLLALGLLLPSVAVPHGGGIDRYGCHHDRTRGGYHCHQGPLAGNTFASRDAMRQAFEARQVRPDPLTRDYIGKVVSIADGDTLTILVDARQIKVRLAEIDTPERGQPYGQRARKTLGNLVFGETVRVEFVDWERYGRMVGRVHLDGLDVNAEMVRQGYAWAYRKYLTDPRILELEHEARMGRRGLWGGDSNVPPWEWRRGRRVGPR